MTGDKNDEQEEEEEEEEEDSPAIYPCSLVHLA
jgi:hypothetical protein